jgi:gliding motility-associated-like protein
MAFTNATVTNITCNGGSDGSITSGASGGVPAYTYSWSNDGTANSATEIGLTAGTYTQTVTDANGCTVSRAYTITQPLLLQIPLSDSIDHCSHNPSGKITARASGGTPPYNYVLIEGETYMQTNTSGVFEFLDAIQYSVQVTDAHGCVAIDSITIPARIPDVFTYTTVPTSCHGSEYNDGQINITPLSSNAPYSYSVDGGKTFSSNSVIGNLGAGYYMVTARNRYGCDTSFTVEITQPDSAWVIIIPNDTMIDLGDAIELIGSLTPAEGHQITSYHWSPSAGLSCDDCPNPTFSSYDKTTNYRLTITYNTICEATGTAKMMVSGEGEVYIPDAFSPNGDGNNDEFQVFGKGIKYATIRVFNRWGEKVFDSVESQFATWNGLYKGALQPPGVYTYAIVIEFLNGKKKEQRGSLTLIR